MCVQARIHSYTKAKSKKSDLALSILCHCQASAVPGSRPKNNCVFKGIFFFSLINYIKKMYTETPSLLKKFFWYSIFIYSLCFWDQFKLEYFFFFL